MAHPSVFSSKKFHSIFCFAGEQLFGCVMNLVKKEFLKLSSQQQEKERGRASNADEFTHLQILLHLRQT
jgi:hypothetical protein